jgi:hypothetical protein
MGWLLREALDLDSAGVHGQQVRLELTGYVPLVAYWG